MQNASLLFLLGISWLLGCCKSDPKLYPGSSNLEISNFVEPIDTPRSFVRHYFNESQPLLAFVGKKLQVSAIPEREGAMDGCFKAVYRVEKVVYGHFGGDTIQFIAYDHYGVPDFSHYSHVLLYVPADDGVYYHQKYLFNDVYLTTDGRWAGSYSREDYNHEGNKNTVISPQKISFQKPVMYATTDTLQDGVIIRRNFDENYFKKVGDSVQAVYGNYLAELFVLKRDGYLTARGIFKNGKIVER